MPKYAQLGISIFQAVLEPQLEYGDITNLGFTFIC